MRPIDYFDHGVQLGPERLFLIGAGKQISFGEAQGMTEAIAKGLYAGGFEIGDSVAVYSPNDPTAVVCIFAAARAGGAWIPISVRNSASTNAEYMAYVGTQWLFFHSEVAREAAEAMASLPDLKGTICIDSDDCDSPSLDAFCKSGAGTQIPDWSDPFSASDHVFSRWPTGGTTGPSKGVEMTNRSIVTMFELGLRHYVGERTDDIVHLAVAPITHAAGLMIGVFAAAGGTTVVHPGFDATQVLAAIEEHKVTHIFLPPTAYYALLDHPLVNNYDYSSLRQILIAAAPVSPDKFREGVDVFGPVICQCYGQAEAPMLISMLSPWVVAAAARGDHPERLKSCGKATSCTQVAILDEDGNAMPRGERGEICCRGPLVTPGYFEKAEATAEAHKFGWHHTGDIGYLDADGYLYIVDRKKDMIITGGFNVFATEVEEPILAMPEVLECAVIGVPDDKWGEAITAVIVLKQGESLAPETVMERCRPKLGGVKSPKSVEFWDAIPKTSVGKTDKKAIRAKFWGERERAVN
ncbi:MAG: AMP-binding protein [Gammaproteobacteria bacterium]|nr:AMP-binding protein [Gammaproteobacteria bacterium]